MAVSEKRLIANRLNAARSTGPKTPEGKAVSRGNSLKHGMTGEGVVLPRGLRDLAEREQRALHADLLPIGVAQARQVEAAALASARMKTTQRQIEARAAQRQRRAILDFDAQRDQEVAALAASIDADPAGAVRGLRRTTEGCEWLIRQVEPLRDWLDDRGALEADHIDRLLKLLGLPGRPTLASEPWQAAWMLDLLAVGPAPSDEELTRFFVLPPEEARAELPPQEEAWVRLAERLETLLEGLDQLRHRLWETIDKPDREEAPLRVLEDDSVEGARLVRYQMTAISTLQRSIAAVKKLQKSEPRRAVIVRQNEPNAPQAAAQNEPISTPADEPQVTKPNGVAPGRPAPSPGSKPGGASLMDQLFALVESVDPEKQARSRVA